MDTDLIASFNTDLSDLEHLAYYLFTKPSEYKRQVILTYLPTSNLRYQGSEREYLILASPYLKEIANSNWNTSHYSHYKRTVILLSGVIIERDDSDKLTFSLISLTSEYRRLNGRDFPRDTLLEDNDDVIKKYISLPNEYVSFVNQVLGRESYVNQWNTTLILNHLIDMAATRVEPDDYLIHVDNYSIGEKLITVNNHPSVIRELNDVVYIGTAAIVESMLTNLLRYLYIKSNLSNNDSRKCRFSIICKYSFRNTKSSYCLYTKGCNQQIIISHNLPIATISNIGQRVVYSDDEMCDSEMKQVIGKILKSIPIIIPYEVYQNRDNAEYCNTLNNSSGLFFISDNYRGFRVRNSESKASGDRLIALKDNDFVYPLPTSTASKMSSLCTILQNLNADYQLLTGSNTMIL